MAQSAHEPFADSGEITLRSIIPKHVPAQALLPYLCLRFTYHSEDQWRSLLEAGRVLVQNAVACPETLIQGGFLLCYTPEPFTEPAANLDYSIVFEDEWLLGVNKPGNLLVHRSGKSLRSNLAYQLRFGEGKKHYPQAAIVNRLDRETSGIVLVAKDEAILASMHTLFRTGLVHKEYLAAVHGSVPATLCQIDLPIGPDRRAPQSCRHNVDWEKGKSAITSVARIEPLGAHASLLTLIPHTGRTHQLRVHCASIGFPIVGDRLYGPDALRDRAIMPRQALHCLQVRFIHPYTQKTVSITAPIPKDMQDLMGSLAHIH